MYIDLMCRWFVKRFFYFDVVVFYEYIFVWDEDLGVENFDFLEWVFIKILVYVFIVVFVWEMKCVWYKLKGRFKVFFYGIEFIL